MRGLPALAISALLSGVACASPGEDYMLYCMGCHATQAQGVPGKIPPLAHSLGLYMRSPAGRDFVLRVPGASSSVLNDAQLAAVLNWVAESYSAEELAAVPVARFTTEEVTRSRHTPLPDVAAMRREVIEALRGQGPAPAADY